MEGDMEKKHYVIEGMSCGHCANSVEMALRRVPGIIEAEVNLEDETAYLTVDEKIFVPLQAHEEVRKSGYEMIVE